MVYNIEQDFLLKLRQRTTIHPANFLSFRHENFPGDDAHVLKLLIEILEVIIHEIFEVFESLKIDPFLPLL